MNAARAPAPLPLSLCLGWAAGTLGVSVMFNAVNILLLRYMTDFLGIAAAAASALIASSKIYDAILNPVMGVVSDRTVSRWGRRRPWLLAGSVIAALALPALFYLPAQVPREWMIAAVAFAVFFYATGYTVFNVPYLAMPAEMNLDYHGRSRIMAFRVATIGIGTLVAGAGAPLVVGAFGGGVAGHGAMAWLLGAIVLLAGLVCVAGTRRAAFTLRSEQAGDQSFGAQWRMAAQNRPFLVLMLVKLLQLLGFAVSQAGLAFFAAHVLRTGNAAIATIITASTISLIASQPLWLALSRRIGKVPVYWLAALTFAAGQLGWLLTGAGTAGWAVAAIALLGGVGSGGMLLIGQSLLPDTIAHDRQLTGLNREGALTGVYSMVEKIAYALGVTAAGLILAAGGYASGLGDASDSQSATAIAAIYACVAWVPALFVIGAAGALTGYTLERRGVPATPDQDLA
jgi:GPH family glycoside/pentoside/hexuronide:cation symporter